MTQKTSHFRSVTRVYPSDIDGAAFIVLRVNNNGPTLVSARYFDLNIDTNYVNWNLNSTSNVRKVLDYFFICEGTTPFQAL